MTTHYGQSLTVIRITNSKGGGNPSNPILFELPQIDVFATNLFAVLRLTYNDSLLTNKPAAPDNTLNTSTTGDDKYKPLGAANYTNLYELFGVVEILAGSESIIKLSGTACKDFMAECFADTNYDEFQHISSARPFMTDDHRVLKIPWVSIFSIVGVDLSKHSSGHFKIIFEYDVQKTGFNLGVKDKFPFIINETFLIMTGHRWDKTDKPADAKNWFSIRDFDIELNNSTTASQLEVNTLGIGQLTSLKLVNRSSKRAYFEKIDLLHNNQSILPQQPLHVLNRSTQLSSDGLYSKPNEVIANFDFKIYPYSSGYWDESKNFIQLNPNDKFTMKLIPSKTSINLASSIETKLVVSKVVEPC